MADTYVTLNEAAELESIGYDTMKKRIHRNPEKFLITKEQRETGGKEMTMVAISSLSKKARTAWKEREKLKDICEGRKGHQGNARTWRTPDDGRVLCGVVEMAQDKLRCQETGWTCKPGRKICHSKKLLGQCREILQGSSTKELCNTAHDEVREMLREKCWN